MMKNKNYIISMMICLCILTFTNKSLATTMEINPKPFVIPELKHWKGASGDFILSENSSICYPANNEELKKVAMQFAEDYKEMFGLDLNVKEGKPSNSGDICLSLSKNKKIRDEEYDINIAKNIEVKAKDGRGVYWATRTLLQMLEQTNHKTLPKGFINDYPDYAIRGFMLDCGRKFIPIHFLEDYVKIMSYYKMNTFQIHLNDNGFKQFFDNKWEDTYSAFRLESETYPGLAAEDGHYTKKEFINLQHMGIERHVEIIPEIDFPAHSLAFSKYMPEIASKEYGMDHLDLFSPKTYEFLDNLLKEYIGGENPVFVGKKVHIGTDEYSNAKKEVVEKFRYLTDRYIKYVESFGKKACVWGALTHAKGDTPVKSKDVLMFAWYNGYADPKEMIKQGYELVSIPDGFLYIVPLAGYYYDYLNINFLYDKWTPAHIGKEVFEEKDKNILGGMFAVWNDHVGNGISTRDIHHRVFPAMQTLAVKMWTGKERKLPFNEFNQKRETISEAPGVNLLGRFKKADNEKVVYSLDKVTPNTEYNVKEAGYGHKISFDIEVAKEEEGTILFKNTDATFYLSDPVKKMIGFSRDGYLNTFNKSVIPGEKYRVTIECTSIGTKLYINDKLIDDLYIKPIYTVDPKSKMKYISTLSFPLEKSGNFKSKITNLRIEKI